MLGGEDRACFKPPRCNKPRLLCLEGSFTRGHQIDSRHCSFATALLLHSECYAAMLLVTSMRPSIDRPNPSRIVGSQNRSANVEDKKVAERLMKNVCVVRAPGPTDYCRMAELAGQLGYESTEGQIRARVRDMQDSCQYSIYVAELPRGRLAGWIGAYVFRAVEVDKCVEISGLVVDQQVRSRGIGTLLLEAVEQWARTQRCDAISVRSNVTRDRAHRFYERNGYSRTKTQDTLCKRLRMRAAQPLLRSSFDGK